MAEPNVHLMLTRIEVLERRVEAARNAAVEECARWHDDGARNADYAQKISALDHRGARRHEENARKHRYAAEQLRALKHTPSPSQSRAPEADRDPG